MKFSEILTILEIILSTPLTSFKQINQAETTTNSNETSQFSEKFQFWAIYSSFNWKNLLSVLVSSSLLQQNVR